MCSAFIPVMHSIPSGKALIENVLCHYPIEMPQNCYFYKRGLNDTYLVQTNRDRYILRVYRRGWRTKQEIDFELELLAFLHEQKLPVAYPIAKTDGSFTEVLAAPEGKRYAAVFSYAPGRVVNKALTSRQSRRLGEVLARIHQTTNGFKSNFNRPTLSSKYLLDEPLEAIAALFGDRKSNIDYLQNKIENLKLALENLVLPIQAPVYGICVGDVHSGNTHFTEKDEPTLFDFDQCGYGWRSFDIAKFLQISLGWKIDNKIKKSFIDGYQAIRPLDSIELSSIPVFAKVAHIWMMGIRCTLAGEVVPYEGFTDMWFDSQLALLNQLERGVFDTLPRNKG